MTYLQKSSFIYIIGILLLGIRASQLRERLQGLPCIINNTCDSPWLTTTDHNYTNYSRAHIKHTKKGADIYTPFCGNTKRATTSQIAYKGNVGVPGDYGCNIMLVESQVTNEYNYILAFDNQSGMNHKCSCWNKIGPDDQITGFFEGNQALDFDISENSTIFVAVDSNSQGGCACGVKSVPLTMFGQFASTWVEFDFGNDSNLGWSGADASCLVAAQYGLHIPGLKVCTGSYCSEVYSGGGGYNAYLLGMANLDGIGLSIPPGRAHLRVTIKE